MNADKNALVSDLEAKLAAAAVANDALAEYERTSADPRPRLAFGLLNSDSVARWRAHVAAVRVGETTLDF